MPFWGGEPVGGREGVLVIVEVEVKVEGEGAGLRRTE